MASQGDNQYMLGLYSFTHLCPKWLRWIIEERVGLENNHLLIISVIDERNIKLTRIDYQVSLIKLKYHMSQPLKKFFG